MSTALKLTIALSVLITYSIKCMEQDQAFQISEINISVEDIPDDEIGLFLQYFRFDQPVLRSESDKVICYLQLARNDKEEQLPFMFYKENKKIEWCWKQPPEWNEAPYAWLRFLERQYKKQKDSQKSQDN